MRRMPDETPTQEIIRNCKAAEARGDDATADILGDALYRRLGSPDTPASEKGRINGWMCGR